MLKLNNFRSYKSIHKIIKNNYHTSINLRPEHFDYKERELLSIDDTSISTFKYDTGVAALRILQYRKKELIILPFQGHQIWDCKYFRKYKSSTLDTSNTNSSKMDYGSIKMKSMVNEPKPVYNIDKWDYLRTYGGFLLHCGILAMGAPGKYDEHPLHGELPNALFTNNKINIKSIGKKSHEIMFEAEYIEQKQFDYNYKFISQHIINTFPKSKMHGMDGNLIETKGIVENHYNKDLKAMYMCHVNFRPELNGKLYQTANNKNDAIDIRTEIPAHIPASQEYINFMNELSKNVCKHEILNNEMMKLLSTEIVMTFNKYKYLKNDYKYAATMLELDENVCGGDNGCYVIKHDSKLLNKAVRWIVYDKPNIEACGMCLPSTSKPNGKTEAIKDNEYVIVKPGNNVVFNVKYGYGDNKYSTQLKQLINETNQN